MADIADMGAQPERRRAAGLGGEQRRPAEMRVARWPRPDTRQRHEVREVERMDDRLADVRANMAGQARQPRLDGADALANASEAEPVDDALDRPDFCFDAPPDGIGNNAKNGQIE